MRALLGLLLLGCGGAPQDALTWTESWELLAPLDDGTVIDARFVRSNTGLLRGQGHVYFDLISAQAGSLRYDRDHPPGLVTEGPGGQGLQLDLEHLRHEDLAWELRLGSTALNATVRVRPEGDPVPASAPDPRWQVEAPLPGGRLTGWVASGDRGGLVEGRGIVLHRHGSEEPAAPRQGAYVVGRNLSLGLEVQGGVRLAWLELDGEILDATDGRLELVRGQPAVIDFRPGADVQVRIQRRKPRAQRDLFDHLSRPEGWLLGMVRPARVRAVQPGIAEVRWGERTLVAPAVLVETGPASGS